VTHEELSFLFIEHSKTLFHGLPGMLAPIAERLANLEVHMVRGGQVSASVLQR